jgi:hypothetical protein
VVVHVISAQQGESLQPPEVVPEFLQPDGGVALPALLQHIDHFAVGAHLREAEPHLRDASADQLMKRLGAAVP